MPKLYCTVGEMIFCCAAQSPSPGGLTGTLTGNDGTPIAGGIISLSSTRTPAPNRSGRRSFQSNPYVTRSRADGSFQFDRLPVGSYQVCAQAPRTQWLNSCDWSADLLTVSATAGATSKIAVFLRKGARVPIRVDDPSRALSQTLSKSSGVGLLVGVGGDDKLFRPAILLSEDASGRTYECLIPFDLPVKLVLSSPSFQLANEQGFPLSAKTSVLGYSAPAAQAPPPVRVIITGVRLP